MIELNLKKKKKKKLIKKKKRMQLGEMVWKVTTILV